MSHARMPGTGHGEAVEAADALLLGPHDDVATALRALTAGTTYRVRSPAGDIVLNVGNAIPMGHKVAVRDVSQGSVIRKHGEVIGAARMEIRAGEHVHVHNVVSLRAR